MTTKYFDKKFAKSLMEPKNILRKELKRHVTKKKSAEEVTYLFTNNYKFC